MFLVEMVDRYRDREKKAESKESPRLCRTRSCIQEPGGGSQNYGQDVFPLHNRACDTHIPLISKVASAGALGSSRAGSEGGT